MPDLDTKRQMAGLFNEQEMADLIESAKMAGRSATLLAPVFLDGADSRPADNEVSERDVSDLRRQVLSLESQILSLEATVADFEGLISRMKDWQDRFDVYKYLAGGRRVWIEPLPGGVAQINVARRYLGLFDLYEVEKNIFKIRAQATGSIWISGAAVLASSESGITQHASGYWYPDPAISESQYIYLELNRRQIGATPPSATMYMATSLPSGADAKYEYTEVVPLWYIPYDGTRACITTEGIVDYRTAPRLPAMA